MMTHDPGKRNPSRSHAARKFKTDAAKRKKEEATKAKASDFLNRKTTTAAALEDVKAPRSEHPRIVANKRAHVEAILKTRGPRALVGKEDLKPIGRWGWCTEDMFHDFVESIKRYPNKTKAVQVSGVPLSMVRRRITEDEEFAKLFADAWEEGMDTLEDEAIRRGVEGVAKPIYQMGQYMGTEQVYSDKLLTLVLTGNRGKYRPGPGPLGSAPLSSEARTQLDNVLREAAALEGIATKGAVDDAEVIKQ